MERVCGTRGSVRSPPPADRGGRAGCIFNSRRKASEPEVAGQVIPRSSGNFGHAGGAGLFGRGHSVGGAEVPWVLGCSLSGKEECDPPPHPLCCVCVGGWAPGAAGCGADPTFSRKGSGATTSATYFGNNPESGERFASPGLGGATPFRFPLEAAFTPPTPHPV